MLRVLEDRIGGAQLDNFALIHHHNVIAEKPSGPVIMDNRKTVQVEFSILLKQ
jgi:hypothetical protein